MDLKSTSYPMRNKFFTLEDPLADKPLRICVSGYSDWITVEQSNLLIRGKLVLDKSLQLGTYQGGQATDFIWSGMPSIICISQRVVDLFRSNHVTGWTIYPVELHNRKGQLLTEYHGFSVIGKEYKRDLSRSALITKPPPTTKGKAYQVYKGLCFNENEWSGEDIFFIQYSGIIITEKVKNIIQKYKITNTRIIALEEVEIDKFLVDMKNSNINNNI